MIQTNPTKSEPFSKTSIRYSGDESDLSLDPGSEHKSVYRPMGGILEPLEPSAWELDRHDLRPGLRVDVGFEIRKLITQKNYPCVAALKSFHKDDYLVGLYHEFGTSEQAATLRRDLLYFIEEQEKSQSTYLSFWAVFDDQKVRGEAEFERDLWEQISSLTSESLKHQDWPPGASTDPSNNDFCFHLAGRAFFVVGLHPNSSRLARRFPYPTLIFNVFSQFEELEQSGQYEPMVATNRHRDRAFQGSVNPMAELYGEKFEAIQFSGQNNPPSWKCPFHFKQDSNQKVET